MSQAGHYRHKTKTHNSPNCPSCGEPGMVVTKGQYVCQNIRCKGVGVWRVERGREPQAKGQHPPNRRRGDETERGSETPAQLPSSPVSELEEG